MSTEKECHEDGKNLKQPSIQTKGNSLRAVTIFTTVGYLSRNISLFKVIQRKTSDWRFLFKRCKGPKRRVFLNPQVRRGGVLQKICVEDNC